jgi:hypothetical protein
MVTPCSGNPDIVACAGDECLKAHLPRVLALRMQRVMSSEVPLADRLSATNPLPWAVRESMRRCCR